MFVGVSVASGLDPNSIYPKPIQAMCGSPIRLSVLPRIQFRVLHPSQQNWSRCPPKVMKLPRPRFRVTQHYSRRRPADSCRISLRRLRGTDGGHGSPATAKGMSASADIHGASQWASRPAARTVRSDGSTSDVVARIKLIQRVSKAFQHLGPDGGSIRIRLAPAELGSVRVEMHVHHRQVRARVVADSEATSSVLREHLPDLRARLESYGLQVERLEVETETADHGLDARQNSDSHWQPPQQQRRSAGSFTTSAPPSLRAEAAVTSVAADSAADILRSASRGVDVRL